MIFNCKYSDKIKLNILTVLKNDDVDKINIGMICVRIYVVLHIIIVQTDKFEVTAFDIISLHILYLKKYIYSTYFLIL